MIVAVDDSGDPGFKFNRGSSRYFCIAAVYFEDERAEDKMLKSLIELKKQLRWKANREFKFHKTDLKTKRAFFQWIKDFDFSVSAMAVDKTEFVGTFAKIKPDSFYNAVIGEVIKNIDYSGRLCLRIDGEKGRAYRRNAKTYFRKTLGKGRVQRLDYVNSKDDGAVQLADMIVGAIRTSFETGNDEFIKMLPKRHRTGVKLLKTEQGAGGLFGNYEIITVFCQGRVFHRGGGKVQGVENLGKLAKIALDILA